MQYHLQPESVSDASVVSMTNKTPKKSCSESKFLETLRNTLDTWVVWNAKLSTSCDAPCRDGKHSAGISPVEKIQGAFKMWWRHQTWHRDHAIIDVLNHQQVDWKCYQQGPMSYPYKGRCLWCASAWRCSAWQWVASGRKGKVRGWGTCRVTWGVHKKMKFMEETGAACLVCFSTVLYPPYLMWTNFLKYSQSSWVFPTVSKNPPMFVLIK